MASGKMKDKLQDGELDLSMMQYTDVPSKEIEQFGGKVTTVNLSHNLLSFLPPTFPLLSHLVKIDLSKNQLSQLPDNFGQLRSLKWLDLYANKLTRLPVSFAQLKSLKWLDLKDNLLVPAIQQAAGPCITPNDCAMCAKKVVALLQSMESQLIREKQRKMAIEQEALEERGRMEEIERERVRQEKRTAKDRRREEQKQREEERRKEEGNKYKQEKDINSNGHGTDNGFVNGHVSPPLTEDEVVPPPKSFLSSLLLFLMGVSAMGVAVGVSMVWIYSEGKLDSPSVQAAVSAIQLDLQEYFVDMRGKTYVAWDNAKPAVNDGVESCARLWQDGGESIRKAAKYVEEHYGDWFASVWDQVGPSVTLASQKIRSLLLVIWEGILPSLEAAWTWCKPHFRDLGKLIIDNGQIALDWLDENLPEFMYWASNMVESCVRVTGEVWQTLTG